MFDTIWFFGHLSYPGTPRFWPFWKNVVLGTPQSCKNAIFLTILAKCVFRNTSANQERHIFDIWPFWQTWYLCTSVTFPDSCAPGPPRCTTICTMQAKFGSWHISVTQKRQIIGTLGKVWFLGHPIRPGTPQLNDTISTNLARFRSQHISATLKWHMFCTFGQLRFFGNFGHLEMPQVDHFVKKWFSAQLSQPGMPHFWH